MKLLLAVDESKNGERMAQYVGALLGSTPAITLTLFHVLKPMPRKLLEHGGSEDPNVEGRLQTQLRQEQTEWYRAQRETECPYLRNARELLIKAGDLASRHSHEVRLRGGYRPKHS